MPRSSQASVRQKPPKASTSRRSKQSDSESDYSGSDSDDNRKSKKKSQSQNTTTQPSVNVELLTTNLVKYVLNHSCNKIPMKRADLSKQLGIPRKEFAEVYSEAQEILNKIYGLELVEVPETKSSKLLITYSSIPIVSSMQLHASERQEIQTLFIVLAYIFMKAIDVPEENLFNFLEQVGISSEDFTKTRDVFVRQLYLKREKIEIEGRSEPHFTVAWGERAKLEFDKKHVLAAVAKIMERSPQSFVNQFHDAHGEQASMTQANQSMLVD